ncbi:MAG: GtrA family protein [Patescibacteria group bacterium]
MKKSDIIAVLILGEIASWLILLVIRGLLRPEIYDKLFNILIIGLPILFPLACLIFLYIALLIAQKIAVVSQIAKFILVGGLNTLVDWGMLSLLIFVFRNSSGISPKDIWLNIFSLTVVYYSLFKAISFIAATVNSYVWNKFWTFRRKTTEKLTTEFFQFIVISVLGFLINVGIASGVFRFISPIGGLNPDQWGIVAAAIATVLSMCWNFLGYKFIVFEKSNDRVSPIS